MFAWEMRSYREAVGAPGPVIFDRGIPDVIGYLRLSGLPVPPSFLKAAERRRYASRVFIAPPWPCIFTQDAERKQIRDMALGATVNSALLAAFRF